MPRPFSYPSCRQPSLVTCGTGAIRTLVEPHTAGDTAFFISGHARVRSVLESSFQKHGTPLDPNCLIVKPAGEPTRQMIENGAEFLNRRPFARVAGSDGGAGMEWCRLAWAVASGRLSLDTGRFNCNGNEHRRPALWLAPTTCASGAEASGVAVFSDDGRKVPVVSRALLADHVLLDGQFLGWVEQQDLARSLCDAMSHAIEAYVSIVPSPLAKHAAVTGLRLILDHWADAPSSARNQHLMEAAYLGGVAASNCSVGIVHAFAHTLAAYGISHASGNAAGLLAGIATNAIAPTMTQFAKECGLPHADALAARIAPIVNVALRGTEALAIQHVLQDRGRQQDIVERISTDVCLRSNPVPLEAKTVATFLARVCRQLSYANAVTRH